MRIPRSYSACLDRAVCLERSRPLPPFCQFSASQRVWFSWSSIIWKASEIHSHTPPFFRSFPSFQRVLSTWLSITFQVRHWIAHCSDSLVDSEIYVLSNPEGSSRSSCPLLIVRSDPPVSFEILKDVHAV